MPYHKEWKRVALISTLVAGMLCLNYFTVYRMAYAHALYRVLFYFPLVVGTFWFGIRGAVSISTCVILLFLPYVMEHWHAFSLEDFHEILEGVLFVVIALTLGVLVERERKRHKALLEASSLAAVGRAISEVAHDMKTPLMAIGGFATQVSRKLDQDDPSQKKLKLVIQEAGQLENMVREMLDFGRPIEMQFKETDLNGLVRETIEVLRPVAENTGVVLKADLDLSLPLFMADAQRVKQVLFNLTTNALEASPKGASVLIRTTEDSHWVKLHVIDSGPGIAEENGESIFKPFFTKKKRGTGLGLPIVKKIVEAHSGQIFFHPNQEKGVIFTAKFPISTKKSIS